MFRQVGVNWRPIETAPRDGTPVLVHVADTVQGWGADWIERLLGAHVTVAAWLPTGDATEVGWVTVMTALAIVSGQAASRRVWPTHWMPLPAPPDSSAHLDFVQALPVSTRAKNLLRSLKIASMEDLRLLVETTPDSEFLRWPKVGRGILEEIKQAAKLVDGPRATPPASSRSQDAP